MNFHSRNILGGLSLGVVLALSAAHAQSPDNRLLILKTQPDDTVIELSGNLDIRSDGSIEAYPVDPEACSGVVGPVDCGDVDVGPPTFRINNSSSATVTEGTSVTFSWNSRGAWDCQAGGDLTGWTYQDLAPRSTDDTRRTFNTAGLANGSAYTATLLCSNGPVQSNDGIPQQVSLTVTAPSDPPPVVEGCEDRPPPAGWRRLSTGNASCRYESGWVSPSTVDCREFEGIWPGPIMEVNAISRGLGLRDSTNGRDYLAIRFTTEGLSSSGRGVIGVNTANGLTNRRKIMTISECPGDFHQDKLPQGCYMESLTQNMTWGGINSTGNCKVSPDKQYFLNVIYTDSPLGTPPNEIVPQADCASGSRCGSLFNSFSP